MNETFDSATFWQGAFFGALVIVAAIAWALYHAAQAYQAARREQEQLLAGMRANTMRAVDEALARDAAPFGARAEAPQPSTLSHQ